MHNKAHTHTHIYTHAHMHSHIHTYTLSHTGSLSFVSAGCVDPSHATSPEIPERVRL